MWRFLAPLALMCAAALSACTGGPGTTTNDITPTPPTITSQPQDQSVTVGSTATFSVTASGTAPLSYQWSRNGTPISDGTGSSYTTPATTSGDDGATFTVEITNSAGSQTSSAATLTVTVQPVAPTITTQPQNQSVTVGSTATFSVVATGTAPLSYQWSKNGTPISNATGASYTTPATVSGDDGATFTVEVTNSAGNQTSNAATLTVTAAAIAPAITTQPHNQTVTAGSPATFSVVASGTAPLSYQWSKNGAAINNATGASYTTPATVSGDNGAIFKVKVSNAAGSQTSSAATLTVNSPPKITTQPQNQSVTVGSTATFSVVASGTAPLSYQWSKDGTAIGNATGASYTTPATVSGDNGATFTVKVTNAVGSQTSSAATLTVTAAAVAPAITTQPQNQSVTVGSMATFSVVASGTAPLSYQWSKNGTAISNATGSSYTTPPAVSGDNGATFTVKVSNSAGSQTSNAATLTVNPSSGAATPVMFQHIASSADPVGSGIPGHAFVFHTESLPANAVAVMGVSAPASVTVTISDSLVGAWSSAVCSASSGASDMKAWVFVQPLGSRGGTDTITINVGSSDTQPVQFDITFWQNINTATPVNGSLCKGNITPSASGTITPGAFTPTNNDSSGGNVIWNYTPLGIGFSNTSVKGYTAAASFNLLNGGAVLWPVTGFPQASQYSVQTSAASVTPSITAAGESAGSGDVFNSATVALAVANNGAVAPATIHVANIIHESIYISSNPGTTTSPFPTTGNLRVAAFTWEAGCPGGGGACLATSGTTISSSDGCRWNVVGSAANGDAVMGYAQGCSPCPTCTVSLHFTGAGNLGGSFRLYDVQNAQASSYQNAASGNSSCGTALNDAPGITPSGASSGLTIASNGIGTGPGTGFASGAPSGAIFDLWTFSGQTDADAADNADSQAHYYFSSNVTQNWNWSLHAPSSCYWVAAVFD